MEQKDKVLVIIHGGRFKDSLKTYEIVRNTTLYSRYKLIRVMYYDRESDVQDKISALEDIHGATNIDVIPCVNKSEFDRYNVLYHRGKVDSRFKHPIDIWCKNKNLVYKQRFRYAIELEIFKDLESVYKILNSFEKDIPSIHKETGTKINGCDVVLNGFETILFNVLNRLEYIKKIDMSIYYNILYSVVYNDLFNDLTTVTMEFRRLYLHNTTVPIMLNYFMRWCGYYYGVWVGSELIFVSIGSSRLTSDEIISYFHTTNMVCKNIIGCRDFDLIKVVFDYRRLQDGYIILYGLRGDEYLDKVVDALKKNSKHDVKVEVTNKKHVVVKNDKYIVSINKNENGNMVPLTEEELCDILFNF